MDNKTKTPAYIPALFTFTIFLSASLLFFVQPLYAKIVLPHIGGAAAVWTTAMLFFQTALIAGYLYAHLLTKYVPVKIQIAIHAVFWLSALLFLPLAVPQGWVYDANHPAVTQTLMLFALGVGLPFTALSANAPLIQAWYAKSGGPSADDPYFLYGASNLGSLISLLAFPLVAEPFLGASKISTGWAIGFAVLGIFLVLSGMSAKGKAHVAKPVEDAEPHSSVKFETLIYWAFLAFIPSSLMLAVTTKITIEVGAMPLIWVIPLALYLLSFVITFTKRPLVSTSVLRILFLVSALPLTLIFVGLISKHLSWASVVMLIVAFFVTAVFVHQKLYESRPDGTKLTVFYLTMSIGGALGGLFNSIVAPVIFNNLHEGIVTIGLAILLLLSENRKIQSRDIIISIMVGAATIGVIFAGLKLTGNDSVQALKIGLVAAAFLTLVLLRKNAMSLFIGAATAIGVGGSFLPDAGRYTDRSFFGLHRVYDIPNPTLPIANAQGGVRVYSNGTTVHGAERLVDMGVDKPRPTAYYDFGGPIEQTVTSQRAKAAKTIGVVGLGVGVMACYIQPGQSWHFYEIDKHVDQIAHDPELFTFMSSCAGDTPTHLGDARMILERQDIKFDILMIDAYSSDYIPVHLTTVEAFEIYLQRLKPDGMLVFHVSNRFYNVYIPILRAAKELGLVARIQFYDQDIADGKLAFSSDAVILARTSDAFGDLATDPRWQDAESDDGAAWTDDYANPLSILK